MSLTNGRQAMDHNDLAFFAYIALSFWGFVAYLTSPTYWRWLLLLGLACGAAMLTKWLSGSLMILVLAGHLVLTKDLSKKKLAGIVAIRRQ
ncbi:MAG: glycosyltransferase family 39 protein [Owenweeksia sp.]|nr:glycosyltransferase family 39 protein [Owenweeksia sp.]